MVSITIPGRRSGLRLGTSDNPITGGGGGGGDGGSGPDLSNAQIGDYIEGGVYAGMITYPDNRKFHIIFALQEHEGSGKQWGAYNINTLADDEYDGRYNTDLILGDHAGTNPAAFIHCDGITDAEGNSDYYVPARFELGMADDLIDINHPEFQTSTSSVRYSSTEWPPNEAFYAWGKVFSTKAEAEAGKGDTIRRVRPVRRVPA